MTLKKNGNDDNNAASVSGYDGSIFYPIKIHWSRGGGLSNGCNGAADTANYISNLLKMCHKLMYGKFGVLDWCCCLPVQLIRE